MGLWSNITNWASNARDDFRVGFNNIFGTNLSTKSQPGDNTSQNNAIKNTKVYGPETPYGSLYDAANYWQSQANASSSRVAPSYNVDVNFNEASAREAATNEYNPYYDKLAEQERQRAATDISRAQSDYEAARNYEMAALDRYLERSGLLETRSKEDLMMELNKIAAEKGMTQAETAYDRVRQMRGLVSELSSRGLQFGGMAAQAGGEAAQGRKLATDRLENAVKSQTSSAETTNTRTLEDLSYGKTERQAQSAETLRAAELNKNRTIEDITRNLQLEQERLDQERQYKIEAAVNQRWQSAYQEWELGLKQFMAKYGISM